MVSPTSSAFPNYIKRIQDIRNRNILSRTKGKPLIFPENQMLDLIYQRKVPTQMQHAILKIMQKVQGTEHERFVSAFNIGGAVFIKHGYQRPASTSLTGKGMRNNTRHRLEHDAGWKKSRYDALVARLWRGYLERKEQVAIAKPVLDATPKSNVGKAMVTPYQVAGMPQQTKPANLISPNTNVIQGNKGPVQTQPVGPKNLVVPRSTTRKPPVEEE